jgi:hypothetical protein
MTKNGFFYRLMARGSYCWLCHRYGHIQGKCKRNPESDNYDPDWCTLCGFCAKTGHGTSQCRRNPASNNYNEHWGIKCDRCNFRGHSAHECRSKYDTEGKKLNGTKEKKKTSETEERPSTEGVENGAGEPNDLSGLQVTSSEFSRAVSTSWNDDKAMHKDIITYCCTMLTNVCEILKSTMEAYH